MPALLRNREQTVEALTKMQNHPQWRLVDAVGQSTKDALEAHKANMPPLPEGVLPNARVMKNYHGQNGLDWLKQDMALQQKAQVASDPSSITRVRGPIFTDTLQSLGRNLDIPTHSVRLEAPKGSGLAFGSVEAGSGILRVAPDFLKGESSELAELSTHEITHLEQEQLIISKLADQIGVGKVIEPGQKTALQAIYKDQLGAALTDQHLNSVLQIRRGEPLIGSVRERADKLISSQIDHTRGFHSAAENTDDYMFLNSMHFDAQAMSARSIISQTIEAAETDPAAARILSEKPLADLISRLPKTEEGAIGYLDRKASKKLDEDFIRILDQTRQGIEGRVNADHSAYRSWFHEEEAHQVGEYFGRRIAKINNTTSSLIIPHK